LKYCYSCKQEKELIYFNKNKRNKDGYATECRDCKISYLAKYREENREVLREKDRAFKEQHREVINERNRVSYHIKKVDEEFLEKKRKHHRTYKSRNKGKVNSDTAKRYTAKMKRIPKWVTKDELKQISELYKLATKISQETGIPHHVDHEVPLQGEFVSGLHTISNLRIITAQENCSKNNKFSV
jgi:flagellum-specific peptidoglycan hydrolase FlgJ